MNQVRARANVSRHDHVGLMRYGPTVTVCTECGQRWVPGRLGWWPLATWEPDPPDLAGLLAEPPAGTPSG